jgi:hypothetical protein
MIAGERVRHFFNVEGESGQCPFTPSSSAVMFLGTAS